MKKFEIGILIIGTWLPCHSFGQLNQIVITGKVVDKTSQEVLPYATIRLKEEPIGVVSNQLGEFIFKISDRYIGDTLMVSMMGYETYQQPINAIRNKDALVVQMSIKATMLNEVVITDKRLSAKEIIEKAISNITFNYPQEPYLLEGFYRDFKKEDEKYIALLEAAVSIYDKGYASLTPKQKNRLQEDVYINQIRNSKTANYKAKVYSDLNLLNAMIMSNDVRYVKDALNVSGEKYELEKTVYLDNMLVYVIRTQYPWMNRIFIEAGSFAILEIEMDAKWEGAHKNEWKMNDSIMNRTPFIRKTMKFKKYEGKYFLEYMSYSWRIEGFKKGSENTLFTSDFFQELLVNNIITKDLKRPARENKMSDTKILELQTKPYNAAFWQNYNIIKEAPLDKKIIKDLEQAGALEDQFKKGGHEKNETKKSKRKFDQ